jgi:RNA polymerase sigma-70 factor, ECF subfamily
VKTEPRPLDRERLPDHLDRLQRAARRFCRSRHDADDLVQETYVRVLARPRLLREGDATGYLLRTLRNVYLAQRVRPEVAGLEPAEHAAAPGRHEEMLDILDAVRSLPAPQRRVLAAVDVAGLSYREAADLLGVPSGTVMSRLCRAREAVARRLAAT